MDRLGSSVNRDDEAFRARREHNESLLATLTERLESVKQGGGGKYVEQHRARGKRLPRERIEAVCDVGTPFLELSSLAACDLYDGNAASA
ncbi:MAG: methylcrotonoyl-CoA carboxylase, partial [Methanobacteriota archaeon]